MELLGIDPVIEHFELALIDALAHVEAPCGFGNGEQTVVAIQIGDVLPTETDDIANVRNARHAKIGRYRPGKPALDRLLAWSSAGHRVPNTFRRERSRRPR